MDLSKTDEDGIVTDVIYEDIDVIDEVTDENDKN